MTADPRGRHGPALPYSLVAGVTPCRGGWLVANAKLQGTVFALEEPVRVRSFTDVVDQRPGHAVVALNAPVGYRQSARPVAAPATPKRVFSSGAALHR